MPGAKPHPAYTPITAALLVPLAYGAALWIRSTGFGGLVAAMLVWTLGSLAIGFFARRSPFLLALIFTAAVNIALAHEQYRFYAQHGADPTRRLLNDLPVIASLLIAGVVCSALSLVPGAIRRERLKHRTRVGRGS